MSKKLLVMAGGTGGHVFPAIAVAQTLQKEGWEICWLGTKDRMEATACTKTWYSNSFYSNFRVTW